MATVSVVLPLHNVAPWLSECLASLRAQSHPDWMAHAVDDGSTDGTGVLLTQTLREEARLRLVFQPPSGVSRARNRALDRVCGNVVAFLDGDDTVSTWWLSEGLRLMAENEADLVRFSFLTRREYAKAHREQRNGATCRLSTPRARQAWGWPTFVSGGYSWRLLIKRPLAQRVRFPEGLRIKEDCVYALHLLPHLSCICESEAAPYCYRMRRSSALHSSVSVETTLRLVHEARRLLKGPLDADASAVRHAALAIFVQQALVDWGYRPDHRERPRFSEVRTAFLQLIEEGLFDFHATFSPHWWPSVGMFLRFGWVLPMRLHGFCLRIFLKIKWMLFGAPIRASIVIDD